MRLSLNMEIAIIGWLDTLLSRQIVAIRNFSQINLPHTLIFCTKNELLCAKTANCRILSTHQCIAGAHIAREVYYLCSNSTYTAQCALFIVQLRCTTHWTYTLGVHKVHCTFIVHFQCTAEINDSVHCQCTTKGSVYVQSTFWVQIPVHYVRALYVATALTSALWMGIIHCSYTPQVNCAIKWHSKLQLVHIMHSTGTLYCIVHCCTIY